MVVVSNPYIAGNPVRGQSLFVGRADILKDVQKLLRNPEANAIVLYGQRRIGKTSILFELEQQLAETGKFLPVYFDLHDKADLSLSEILYRLAEQISRHVDGTAVDRRLFDAQGSFFRKDFLPDAVCTINKRLVLLLDEFDVLDRPYKGQVGATFLPYLRRWIARTCDVNFILAMGRRPDELSPQMLSTFKRTQTRQVSLMDLSESLAIVRQSEQNHSLYWADSGINRVCYWTKGHPYLTQLLCSEVWEELHDDGPVQPPTATADDVDLAIAGTLEQGANAFQWIWNGLTPAEKVTLSAMAATGKMTVSRQTLRNKVARQGDASFRRELEMAPDDLCKRDLLRRSTDGYRFAIPLLQRWIVENKPLRRVQGDLASLVPQANTLFARAQDSFAVGDLADTELRLRHTLAVNPKHVPARLLLGRVHLANGKPAEAVGVIESAFASDPSAARDDLVTALLALAGAQSSEDEKWRALNRAQRIDPQRAEVREQQAAIYRDWATRAMEAGDYQAAINAYQQLNDEAGVATARRQMRLHALAARLPGFSRLTSK